MKKTIIFCGLSIFYLSSVFFLYQESGRQVSSKNSLNDDLKIKTRRDAKIRDNENVKIEVNKDIKPIANEDIKINAKNILPVWKDAIADISKVTKVPILIPEMMPAPSIDTNRQIFGYSSSDKDSYTIYLGFYNPCPITKNCIFFSITGELITDKTQSGLLKYQTLAQQYKTSQERNCQEFSICRPWAQEGGEIILAKGIKAVYIPSYCYGSGCSFAEVVWVQDNYQYTVAIEHEPSTKKIIDLANSAIENQP